jgi:hypothetical protein
MAFTFTLNGHEYTSDPNVAVEDGYRFDGYGYMKALPNLVVDLVAVMTNYLTLTNAAKDAAQASALTAVNAPGTAATSTTSMIVGYGMKALVLQPGKLFKNGMSVDMVSLGAPTAIWMHGKLDTYDIATGNTSVKVTALSGLASTAADWSVFNCAPGGATLDYNRYTGSQFYAAGIFEGYVDMGASNTVDLSVGTLFKKVVTAPWTLVIIGVPDGAAASFTLKLINGGQSTTTLPAGSQFSNGVAPLLSFVGTDRLHFVREPGGTWEVYLVGSNVKLAGT